MTRLPSAWVEDMREARGSELAHVTLPGSVTLQIAEKSPASILGRYILYFI